MGGNISDAIDLTGSTRSSGRGPRQDHSASGLTHAIDLDAADSMPEGSANPEQATDISGLTEKLQQQLTIRPTARLPHHAQDLCQQGNSLPHADDSTAGAGELVTANKQLSRAHVVSSENEPSASCPTSRQPGKLPVAQQPQCSRSHPTDLPIDVTHQTAASQVSKDAKSRQQMQRPLSSISNVLHQGKQAAAKNVSDQPLPVQQKPAASQGIPKAAEHQPSAAHAQAPQQSCAGATCAQNQPGRHASGAAAPQCAQASDRAAWEAEVALLKRTLHKYCAILASEPGRRELPDGGLKVLTQPHSRAALPQHINHLWDLAPRAAELTIALTRSRMMLPIP